jgi:alpha-amylase
MQAIQNCWLSGLPDLKQENNNVANTLTTWIKQLVTTYGFDGLRIDTVPEVPKWFWTEFAAAAGVY